MSIREAMINKLGSEQAYQEYMSKIGSKGGKVSKRPAKVCTLCPRKHIAQGYCSIHYYQHVTKQKA